MSFQRVWVYLGREGVLCENEETFDKCMSEGYQSMPYDIKEEIKVIKKVVKKKAAKKRAVKKEG